MNYMKSNIGTHIEIEEVGEHQYMYYIYLKYPLEKNEVIRTITISNTEIYINPDGHIAFFNIPISKDLDLYEKLIAKLSFIQIKDNSLQISLDRIKNNGKKVIGNVNLDLDKEDKIIGIEI